MNQRENKVQQEIKHTGVIFSNCFFFGFRISSGFPSYLQHSQGASTQRKRY
ncbi:hypothetical protein COCNU_contig69208090G000010 [Cocos nucifera]|nr:hypothetical protein [Cocos nucifera]